MIDPEYVAEPLRKRIAELEAENKRLREALEHAEGVFMRYEINDVQGEEIADRALDIARAALSQEEKTCAS